MHKQWGFNRYMGNLGKKHVSIVKKDIEIDMSSICQTNIKGYVGSKHACDIDSSKFLCVYSC